MAVRTKEQIEADNAARLRRAELWLRRAQSAIRADDPFLRSVDDNAVRFVFWWIAFEAAYSTKLNSANERIKKFIGRIVRLDEDKMSKMYRLHKAKARELVALPPTHDGFWNGAEYRTHAEWRAEFDREREICATGATADALKIVFSRLRVVRHQIFHGANSRHKSYGRAQVKYGKELLAAFVPRFIEVVDESAKKSPPADWGTVPFPRQGARNQKDLSPVWKEQIGIRN